MANIRSQIKRVKTNRAAEERNKPVRTGLKSKIRKFREVAATGDVAQAEAAFKDAAKALDKAASAGVIHRNQAANRKSAIANKLASLKK